MNDGLQAADFSNLGERELFVVSQSLVAILDEVFVEDDDFQSVTGLTRDEMRTEAMRFPKVSASVVVAALNNLCGYPHGQEGFLEAEYGLTRAEIRHVLSKVRF